jgi:hypothetical protein
MKRFILQTAKQTGCHSPATIDCIICKNDFMAGKAPSMFIYYDSNNCSKCKTPEKSHSHCAWLCSGTCTEIWIVRNK